MSLAERDSFRDRCGEKIKIQNEYVLAAFSLDLVRVAELDVGATERNEIRNVRPTDV